MDFASPPTAFLRRQLPRTRKRNDANNGSRLRRRHSIFDVRDFAPGDVIVRQGEIGDSMYFVQSGTVEVEREGSGVVARLSAGDYFGEMALLSNEPRNATVRSVTSPKLALLGKSNFLAML